MTPFERYTLLLISAILLLLLVMSWSAYNAYAELNTKLGIYTGKADELILTVKEQAPSVIGPLQAALNKFISQK